MTAIPSPLTVSAVLCGAGPTRPLDLALSRRAAKEVVVEYFMRVVVDTLQRFGETSQP